MQVKDPVCGMSIESTKAQAQEVHQGRPYFFCSDQCRRQFLTSPKRYAAQQETIEQADSGRGSQS